MRTSWEGVAFIARCEAMVLTAYQDGEHRSIGFGSNSPDLKAGDTITADEAFARLRVDIEAREAPLAGIINVYICGHMWDALMSLGFNTGMGALERSTVITRLNEGNYAAAADEFLKIKSHTPGLLKRREAERLIFLDAEYGDNSKIKCWTGDPRTTKPELIDFPREEGATGE